MTFPNGAANGADAEMPFLCEALVAEVGDMASALGDIASAVTSASALEISNIAEALNLLQSASPSSASGSPHMREVLKIAHSGRVLLDLAKTAVRDATELRVRVEALEQELGAAVRQAGTDKLTGLLTRSGAEPKIAELFKGSASPHCVAVIDIDHFKTVNDEYGHPAGDQALTLFAHTVRSSIRETDVFMRWGGEEFAVVFANTNLRGAVQAAEAIRANLARTPLFTDAGKLVLTCSVGVAERAGAPISFEELFDKADKAMYLAKTEGRNCVRVAR